MDGYVGNTTGTRPVVGVFRRWEDVIVDPWCSSHASIHIHQPAHHHPHHHPHRISSFVFLCQDEVVQMHHALALRQS